MVSSLSEKPKRWLYQKKTTRLLNAKNRQNIHIRAKTTTRVHGYSIPVSVALVGTIDLDPDIVCLLFGQCCELCPTGWQVETCNLFVQMLWQQVDIVLVLLGSICLLPIPKQI